jgi:hypothetical protein
MTESERKPTMTLADALAKVSCTSDEAAVFLNAIGGQMAEVHGEFKKAVTAAADALAYPPPAETKPAEHSRSVTVSKND